LAITTYCKVRYQLKITAQFNRTNININFKEIT
jgi:hypothetical protein